MKNIILFLLLASAIACTQVSSRTHSSNQDQENSRAVEQTEFDKNSFSLVNDASGIYSFQELQLFPLRASVEYLQLYASLGNYFTLKEAMDLKMITITERVDVNSSNTSSENRTNAADRSISGETVNTLYIENTSNDTVFIMAGELVHGGKQDRLIAKDFLLYPKSGKVDISVYCVEHGRWAYDNISGEKADALSEVRFSTDGKVVTNKVRKEAVKEKDQSKVWKEVAIVTEKNAAKSSTGSYNALDASEAYSTKLEGYLKFFENKFDQSNDIIGVIVVSGNSVIGCDLFCKPDLFRREYKGLLHAYITDAITFSDKEKLNPDVVMNYFTRLQKDYADPSDRTKDNKFIHEGKIIHFTGFGTNEL